MARTRTGSFPIGFRRGGGQWQKSIPALAAFARDNAFEALDVGGVPAADLAAIRSAGLQLGSVDLKQWSDLLSGDVGKRRAAADANIAWAKEATGQGASVFFAVAIPEDAKKPRRENFSLAVESLGRLCEGLRDLGGRVALEGWPGNGANLACTPADYRALFQAVGAENLGVNFDPSHLIRMGIDPVRFLDEFASRVFHTHAKDTELLDDELYEHGNLQPATFAKPHGFGGHCWRYCIPGHGCARWAKLWQLLERAGYRGVVSIELEDENFNGTEEGEKRGLLATRDFLANV